MRAQSPSGLEGSTGLTLLKGVVEVERSSVFGGWGSPIPESLQQATRQPPLRHRFVLDKIHTYVIERIIIMSSGGCYTADLKQQHVDIIG